MFDVLKFLDAVKTLMLTNGGLAIIGLVVFIWFHRKEHGLHKKEHAVIVSNNEVVRDVQEKLNKFIWKFEAVDIEKKEELINHLQSHHRALSAKLLDGLCSFVSQYHEFTRPVLVYADELYAEALRIWSLYRKENPLWLDIGTQEKVAAVNATLLPHAKLMCVDVARYLTNPTLNGSKQRIVFSCINENLLNIEKLWRDIIEKEFR